MTPLPPDRTDEQRRSALDRANVIRSARALVKQELARPGTDGLGLLLALVKDPHRVVELVELPAGTTEDVLDSMLLSKLLQATRTIGRVKAKSIMRECEIQTGRHVGQVTDRERYELTVWVANAITRHNNKHRFERTASR